MKGRALRIVFMALFILLVSGCNSGVDENSSTEEENTASAEENESVEGQEEEKAPEVEEKPEEELQGEEMNLGEPVDAPIDEPKQNTEENNEEVEAESTGLNIGDYEVYLGGEMIEKEDVIEIQGESNLIPGSRVVGQVSVGEEDILADTTELVEENGAFSMEIQKPDLKEEATVTVMFHFDGHQDDEVKRHYGDRGQELTGPYIYKHKGKVGGGSPQNIYQMAKVEVSFIPGEDMAIRQFKEPNWYEIPEDMGDPRVWIEVEEINNDENYFYLHGRSNLLEGTILRGKYAGNRDETSVKPDGSFDMVFEYVYEEDESFVIEFDPSYHKQWNIIEETYGATGQKLVGELVVQNKWNDNQTIVKEEKHESLEISVPDNVELEIDGADVTMLVPEHLLFDFDKYDLKEESKELLLEISETLDSFDKDIEIEISGHADSNGDEKHNLELSENRAEAVKDFLVEDGGLKDISFTTVGYGETKPIASNDSESGRAKNRRVEIIINLR